MVIAFMSLGLYKIDALAAILCFVEMPVTRVGTEGKDRCLVGGASGGAAGLNLELSLLLITDVKPIKSLRSVTGRFSGRDLD